MSSSQVNTDMDWLEGEAEHKYTKAGLPAVEYTDCDGKGLLMRDGDGLLLSRNISPDILQRYDTFQARDDDVLIATFPKSGSCVNSKIVAKEFKFSGSHWMWEIVSMLTQGSETLSPGVMQHVDYFPVDMLDALPSPRVLSTHMPFSRVPRDFLSCDCKLIWVVRNPWDVAVSYYHFIKNISVFQYTGQWSGFFDLFLDGSMPYNSWFEHTLDWLKGMETTNILMVRYEDLHLNFKKEILRIAEHLGIDASDSLVDAIHRETSFANMAQNKVDMTIPISISGTSTIYRKGKCGDWRNWFTEKQAAELKGAYRVSLGHYQRRLQYNVFGSV